MAMETMNDSIKYVYPKYTRSQAESFQQFDAANPFPATTNMDGALDDPSLIYNGEDQGLYEATKAMYETTEDRYVTEVRKTSNCTVEIQNTKEVKIAFNFKCMPFGKNADWFKNGVVIYVKDAATGKNVALCMQMQDGSWLKGNSVISKSKTSDGTVEVKSITAVTGEKASFVAVLDCEDAAQATYVKDAITIVGKYDSERDLMGEYLGEVELQMKTYNFRPRPITLGVTWTQMAELTLDTSFGLSAEEMLLDYASQEIKKSLDFQAVKFAYGIQGIKAAGNFVKFNAEAGKENNTTKDSYYHTAQLISQPIARIKSLMLNKFNRGGVTAIVGGPAAVDYLSLSEHWSDRGAQVAIGGHKCGELNGKIRNAVVKAA